MSSERSKKPWLAHWDERFSRGEETLKFEPSSLLVNAVKGIKPELALDLASGAGRHSLFLAKRGWQVDAVDGSQVGLDVMAKQAERRGLSDNITAHLADLEVLPEQFEIAPKKYDLIVDFCFMYQPLFARIRAGLRPGGLFVAAIHVTPKDDGSPRRFALESGELEEMMDTWGWEVFEYRERKMPHEGQGREGQTTAELVAQKPLE